MGINSIKCEGYADVKEVGFGKGIETASDLEGTDVLKCAAIMAIGIAAIAIAGCLGEKKPEEKDYLFNGTKLKETESAPAQIVKPVHVSEFTFGKEGEIGEMRNRFTNESYQIKFGGIEREYVPAGIVAMPQYVAHLFITDISTSETKSIVLRDGKSIDIDKNLSAHIDVGSDYATFSIRER